MNAQQTADYQHALRYLEDNADQLAPYERLISFCEALEGGIGRNSAYWAVDAMRDAYDRLLARFPLMFGFWSKYASLEFTASGVDAAELVYARALAAFPTSVDLWGAYLDFKTSTTHDSDNCRDLFERALETAGLDFHSGPIFDKYIAYERRLQNHERVVAVLARASMAISHQWQSYSQAFNTERVNYSPNSYLPAHVISRITAETRAAHGNTAASFEAALHSRVEQYVVDEMGKARAATHERWNFESGITRPYFNTPDLEESELQNWRAYLDFEERAGDQKRVEFLYERSLISAANYEDFWLRYLRWMSNFFAEKTEDIRNIYSRASSIYMPIAKPAIRLQWALFEEVQGCFDAAAGIYEGILMNNPGHYETIVAWVNAARRVRGHEAALDVLRERLSQGEMETSTKALLYAEFARILWKFGNDAEAARGVYHEIEMRFLDCVEFWRSFLCFEIEQSTGQPGTAEQHARVRSIHSSICGRSHLGQEAIDSLSAVYMRYLLECGDSQGPREYLALQISLNHQNPIGSA